MLLLREAGMWADHGWEGLAKRFLFQGVDPKGAEGALVLGGVPKLESGFQARPFLHGTSGF